MSYVVFETESDDLYFVALCFALLLEMEDHSTITKFLQSVRLRKNDAELQAQRIATDKNIHFHYTSGDFFFNPSDGLFLSVARSDTSLFSWTMRMSLVGNVSTIAPACFSLYRTMRRCGDIRLYRNAVLKSRAPSEYSRHQK